MKQLIILCTLLTATTTINAGTLEKTLEKTLMKDYLKTKMDYMFEVKTNKYEKVILDCQSFIQGISFYNNKKVAHFFYLDPQDCQDLHFSLKDSKENKVPVCFEISEDTKVTGEKTNSLNIVNDSEECI